MLEEGRISGKQMVFLVIVLILSTLTISVPSQIYREAGRDSWLSAILITAIGVVAGDVTAGLGMRFPGRNIFQYGELLVGRILVKAIGFLFIVFLLYANAIFIREFADMFVTYIMLETPILVFLTGFAVVSAYIVRSGLEVLVRVNQILITMGVVGGLLTVALISPEVRIENFTPVLEDGIMPVLKGAFYATPFSGEIIAMLIIIPYLNRPQEAQRAIFSGTVFASLVMMTVIDFSVAVLGERMARDIFPVLTIVRQVSIAELIERVEPIFIFSFLTGGIMKMSLFYYCTVLTMSQWLNLKEYKALVLPVGVLTTALSVVLWGSFVELFSHITKILPFTFLPLELGLPLLLLAIARLRRKGGAGRKV